jgi:predicted TIM-barrel fold metal-dependent hydrolase
MIDIHRHLWNKDWFPPGHRMAFAVRAAKRTPLERDPLTILPRVGEGIYDRDGALTIGDMEDLDISASVVMVLDWGMAYVMRGLEDAPLPIREINRQTLEICALHPGRLYGFCGVDPRRKDALQLFETAVSEWGAVGLKVYPPCGYYATDNLMLPLYRKACDLNVPVLIHTGASMFDLLTKYSIPEQVEEVAAMFPDLTVIWGHSNLQGRFESGAYWRAIQIAGSMFNIYLDLCDWQVTGALDDRNIAEFWHVLDVMRNTVGAHRMLWGTDLPMRGRGYELTRRWTEMFRGLPAAAREFGVTFTDQEAALICHENAERLMGIPAPAATTPG